MILDVAREAELSEDRTHGWGKALWR